LSKTFKVLDKSVGLPLCVYSFSKGSKKIKSFFKQRLNLLAKGDD